MAQSRTELVIVTESTEGQGTQDNPYRTVTEYFKQDGTLLFRKDEHSWVLSPDAAIEFGVKDAN